MTPKHYHDQVENEDKSASTGHDAVVYASMSQQAKLMARLPAKEPQLDSVEVALLTQYDDRPSSREKIHSITDNNKENRPYLTGWRLGIIVGASIVGSACVLNITLTIWASISFTQSRGISTFYEGTCGHANTTALWIHLAINAISACMLSASNYAMQCLAAPTRSELDRAHARHSWLDVGMNSIRNMLRVNRTRGLRWLILGISSLPIHLLYNSVVLKVLAHNEYSAIVVNPQFLSSSPNSTNFTSSTDTNTLGAQSFKNCSLVGTNRTSTPSFSFSSMYSECHFSDCQLRIGSQASPVYPTLSEVVGNCTSGACSVEIGTKPVSDADSHLGYGLPLWTMFGECNFEDCHVDTASRDRTVTNFADIVHQCFDPDQMTANWQPQAAGTRLDYANTPSAYTKLTLSECLMTFGNDYVSEFDNVILVAKDNTSFLGPSAFFYFDWSYNYLNSKLRDPHSWLCNDEHRGNSDRGELCSAASLKNDLNGYTLGGQHIDYCLARQVDVGHCKLQFSPMMLGVVVACIGLKAIVIISLLFTTREEPVLAIGDAVASYLDRQDEMASGRCLFSAADRRQPIGDTWNTDEYDDWQPGPITYHAAARRTWFEAGSQYHLAGMTFLGFGGSAAAGYLLRKAVNAVYANVGPSQSPWSLGFGTVNSQLLVPLSPSGSTEAINVMAAVLLANMPQLLASLFFLLCNGFLTSMLLAAEWSGYGKKRKALRVASKRQGQRSTYFLQLPFRYSVPLLIASSLLHWLISEALFVVRVEAFNGNEQDYNRNVLAIGYSPLPILLAILLIGLMVISILGLSARKLESNIPIVSSNSLAIAAACFRPADDDDASISAVKWGEVLDMGSDRVGHCCITSFDVSDPIDGKQYAGTTQGGLRSRRMLLQDEIS